MPLSISVSAQCRARSEDVSGNRNVQFCLVSVWWAKAPSDHHFLLRAMTRGNRGSPCCGLWMRRLRLPNRTPSLLAAFNPPALPIGICGAAWIQGTAIAFGKEVTVQNYGHDKYTRTIGEVILPDGINLNQEIVKRG